MKRQKKFIARKTFHADKIILIISLIFTIAILIFSLVYRKVGNYDIETDFFWDYAPEARNILKGKINVGEFRGPGYPAMLGISSLLVGDIFKTGIFISAISAGFVIILTFKLLSKIFDEKVAFIVSISLIFNPTFVRYSYVGGTDMFFNLLVSLAVYLAFSGSLKNKLSLPLLSGLFAGYSYLTRYNGIAMFLGLSLSLLILNRDNLRKAFWKILTYIAGYSIFLVPWSIYSYIQKGEFFYNKNYLNIAYEMYAKGKIP